jgi:hypothetical protein
MNTKTTLVLALVCVAVFSYLMFVEKPWQVEEATEPATADRGEALFDPKPEPDAIDRVELDEDAGRSFVFVRRGEEGWDLAEPVQAKASKTEVNDLVRTISDLAYVEVYAPDSADRPSNATTGLDRPMAEVKLISEGDVQSHVLIGARVPTGEGNYVKLAEDDRVFVSKKTLNTTFGKRLADYRDKRVLNFKLADVQRVKVEGVRNFELVREDKTDWLVEAPYRGEADKTEAEKVVRPLTTLRAKAFIDDDPLSLKLYGLEEPQLKVTLDTERTIPAKAKPGDPDTKPADTQPSVKEETFVLLVGAAADTQGEHYFARLEDGSAIFTIRQDTYDSLTPEIDTVLSESIASVQAAKVKKVEVVNAGGTMVLTKDSEGGWRFEDGAQADRALVSSLIKAVNDMTASEYIDLDSTLAVLDWDRPRARVAFTQRGQRHPTTVLVGPDSASGEMVYVRNEASQAVAAVRAASVEQLLEPPIAYRGREIFSFNPAQAGKIEIIREEGGPVRLVREGDEQWMLSAPISAPADTEAVRYALQDLATLNAKRVLGAKDFADYGLDDPEVSVGVAVVARPTTQPEAATQPATTQAAGDDRDTKILKQLVEYQKTNPQENPEATKVLKEMLATREASPSAATQPAGPKIVRYILHLSTQDGKVYAASADKPMVYELDRRVYEDLTAEMHDRTITDFKVTEVDEIAFRGDGESMTLRQMGEDTWQYAEDPLVPIDSEKVKDVVNAFNKLRTHRFVNYSAEDVSAYGLDDPAHRVRIVLEGDRQHELLLSAQGPAEDADQSRYAMLAGSSKVFLLKGEQAAKFAQKLEDVEKTDGN